MAARRPKPRTRKGPAPARRRASRRSPAELHKLTEPLSWERPTLPVPVAPIAPVTRRLRILMVGWEFPPSHTGGLGVHCFELCKELTRMGHRVTFLSPFPGPFTPVEGVEFRHPGDGGAPGAEFPTAYWGGGPGAGPFASAIDGYNAWIAAWGSIDAYDLVHVHDWFGTEGAVALTRRSGKPLVMTVHSTEFDRSLGQPWEHIRAREELGIRAADAVIAVSRHLGQQLVDRYGARPESIRVIYNAVRPPPRLAPVEASQRVVLYLGRLAAMKGVDTFLRAAQRVARSLPDVLFVVAGEGPEFPRLVDLAAHLGIGDRVLFLGHVTEDERTALLASASVFVLPSVVEPFGIAALEAMASGVPVLLSKTSGVAEIARHVFAIDFWDTDEFASRMQELLEYPVLRREMGEGGRAEALREGWPERALQTVGVYAEVVRRRSEGP